MRHAKRRKLTVEDFNRALRWSNVEVREYLHVYLAVSYLI